MGLPHGPSQFTHSLFVGLVLVSLCDTKVSLSINGCGVPAVPVHGLPQCQPPLCEEPLDAGMFKPGTLMEFYCQSSYTLAGLPALSICQGGEWHVVRELVCKPHGTKPSSSLTIATSIPVVVAAVVMFSVLAVLVMACMMLMPRFSICRCTEPASSAYEAMEDPEDLGHMDWDQLDNDRLGPLPSYEEAICGHLGSSLLFGGHNSGPLVLPRDIASCCEPTGPSHGGLTCLRPPPSYQEALEETTSTDGRDVPEGDASTRLTTQDLHPVLGMGNIC